MKAPTGAIQIRPATPPDAGAIAAIYAYYVRHGTATFDTVPRSCADTAARITACAARGWPFLVAECAGQILGYAYATSFRDRPAYDYTCEDSVYIHPDHLGQGLGRALLAALLSATEAGGFRQMIAVITGDQPASIALHAGLGFHHTGRMPSVGRKFGRWLDTVYMQTAIGAGDSCPPQSEP